MTKMIRYWSSKNINLNGTVEFSETETETIHKIQARVLYFCKMIFQNNLGGTVKSPAIQEYPIMYDCTA